ncbi:4-hydroxy-tetrahydrodipicolinate reductase [Halovenus sp. WSH3]|uniref:4-hydroxy-tetrahydrodipicolinate reductase n=1 Tax=Halovenus carboxidivorans TaxID=2692199 RepID=A0A6B0TAR2_9EURY|nr:4-hydroxy-tetrahydrodipicolinate reductase [Halovenus carboxidivorans]MXR51980.1 4-hydroxy-tetrahydrodipicolinate reductase [Halovenus carboxidivorans]
MTTVGINGITGRMGEAIRERASERADVSVTFGIAPSEADLDVPVYEPGEAAEAIAEHAPDAVIDFAVPEGTINVAEACAEAGVALVVGTTGFDDAGSAVLDETSNAVPVLKATNFARGIHALLRTLGPALGALEEYDVEVMETHHNGKRDAPSGTAKTILEEISEYREFDTVPGREGIQPREDDEVGMLVRRAGDIRGEHEIILAGNDEVLSLSHRAEDRGVFAAGALDAAVWLVDQGPGRYEFGDVIDA